MLENGFYVFIHLNAELIIAKHAQVSIMRIVPVIGLIRGWRSQHLHGYYLMDKVKTGLCSLCATIFQKSFIPISNSFSFFLSRSNYGNHANEEVISDMMLLCHLECKSVRCTS